MNAIFQALAYVPSVREYLKEHYERMSTRPVVELFHAMYTGNYNVMVMGKIVRNFETSDINPVTFLKYELPFTLDEGFFEGFSIVKVSLLAWKTIEAAITLL